ncbi:MAG: hypothetical protein RL215_1454 [Planctomycetota bacterium]
MKSVAVRVWGHRAWRVKLIFSLYPDPCRSLPPAIRVSEFHHLPKLGLRPGFPRARAPNTLAQGIGNQHH